MSQPEPMSKPVERQMFYQRMIRFFSDLMSFRLARLSRVNQVNELTIDIFILALVSVSSKKIS